jgi:ABC-type transporter Mla MlaB component
MLRITVEEKDNLTNFRLEGSLQGDWVKELQRCWIWIYARNVNPRHQFSIDLSNVNFVDESGKALLTRMASQNAKLQATSPMMTSLIQEINELSAAQACALTIRG